MSAATARARSASAPVVSRTLRAAGFVPSQPSRACPEPILQVRRGWSAWGTESVVVVRSTRVSVPAVERALRDAGYAVEARQGTLAVWAFLYVTEGEAS